jgi:xanthine dehydrogenase small subunit
MCQVTLNGRPASLDGVDSTTSALDWLRGQGLTGAKEGCGEGECGACAVLVARPGTGTPCEWVAVNSCLLPALALAGGEVRTAEGLGTPGHLHPVQEELADRGGSQCGYCTPGVVCAMAAEYYRPDRAPGPGAPADRGFDLDALGGNLCRCTGYRPIRDAALALASPAADDPLAQMLTRAAPVPPAMSVPTPSGAYVRPASLVEAVRLLAEEPLALVVAGATDWGVEVNLRNARAPLLLAVDQLPELRALEVSDTHISIGAALSLTEVQQRLAGRIPLLAAMFPRFASRPIRNSATLGGNLATASPIGDAAPALLALDARLVLAGPSGGRVVDVADFFTGYRRTALQPGELIVAIEVPLPLAGLATFQKVAKRHLDDISSVAIGLALEVEHGTVTRARIGLGGVAATPIRARATEAALVGQAWDTATAARAADALHGEGTPLDDHRASADYRRAMLGNALLRLQAEGVPDGARR